MMRMSMKLQDWPTCDKALFLSAFVGKADPFDDGINGKHLASRTIAALTYAYGRWLQWLACARPEILNKPPSSRLGSDVLQAYYTHLSETCIQRGCACYLHGLYTALRYMCPDQEWGWLLANVRRIANSAPAKLKPVIPIDSACLAELGEAMMSEAMAVLKHNLEMKRSQLRRVCEQGRDGLLLMFLSTYPLRRSSLEKLMIGENILRDHSGWSVCLPAEQLKNRKAQNVRLPDWLGKRVDEYVSDVRCRFPRASSHAGLWASWRQCPLNGDALYMIVRKRAKRRLGVSLTLHDVRRVAATSIAISDPKNVMVAADLLGHSGFKVTEEHYIRGQSIQASRFMAGVVERLRGGKS
jgi:integrase